MEFKQGFYRNKKNNSIYYAEKILTNCTNINDGEKMVEYYPYKSQFVQFSEGYVRKYEEFMEKFDKITIND